jgi:hypothetical protein
LAGDELWELAGEAAFSGVLRPFTRRSASSTRLLPCKKGWWFFEVFPSAWFSTTSTEGCSD